MNAHHKTALLLAGLLALATGAQPTADAADPPSAPAAGANDAAMAIRAAGKTWDAAYKALDAKALAALYARDAVLMIESAPTVKGAAQIGKFLPIYLGLFAEGGYKPVIGSAVEIEVSGNLGIRSGTYRVTDKSGSTVDTGKWLEAWRRVDGKWRIVRDVLTSDELPLFPPIAYTQKGWPQGTTGKGQKKKSRGQSQ